MPRFALEIRVALTVDAVNEFDARHVALECWGLHRASGYTAVGAWSAEPGEVAIVSTDEKTRLPAAARETPPRIPAPPPERRYHQREPELGIF